jgi:TfoX/Sxy family transcriptional regulator of competence genes
MAFPSPDPSSRVFLESILPPEAGVDLKPMFGNTAGFMNGHMFAGTFGSDIVVRLPEVERARLLAEPGAAIFEPMQGRVMREYVVLPRAWRDTPEKARRWTASALAWVSQMPPKPEKKRKTAAKKPAAAPAKPATARKAAGRKPAARRPRATPE